MASIRYCDNNEPHDSHEWHESFAFPDYVSVGTFRCWGVKPTAEVQFEVGRLIGARAHVADIEKDLAMAAERARRTEAEFYGGDGTKCGDCLDQGEPGDGCEECGKVRE